MSHHCVISPSAPSPKGFGGLAEAPGLASGTSWREVRRLGPPASRQAHQTVWKPPHGGRYQDLLVRHDTSLYIQSQGGNVGKSERRQDDEEAVTFTHDEDENVFFNDYIWMELLSKLLVHL